MANYATLKAAVEAVIAQNGNNEITGNILQQTLLSIINSLGAGFQFIGVATPATVPGTPDYNVIYLASESGIYPNFNSLSLNTGEVAILKYNGSWTKETTGIASSEAIEQVMAILTGEEIITTITSFTDTGKFLYNDTTLESSNYNITEYINCHNASRIVLTNLWASTDGIKSFVFYDSSKQILSSNPLPAETGIVNYDLSANDIPANAYYIRCTQNYLYNSSIEIHFAQQVGILDRLSTLESQETILSGRITQLEQEQQHIGININPPKNQIVDFTTYSGTHLNTSTGATVASNLFTASGFVPVEPLTQYASGKKDNTFGGYRDVTMMEICYYNANKVFISGESSKSVITTPANARFLRFSVLSTQSSLGSSGIDDIADTEIVLGNEPISVFGKDLFSEIMPLNGLYGKKWLIIGDSNTEHNARAHAKYDEFIKSYTGIIPQNIGKSGAGYRVYENTNYVFLNILNSFAAANPTYVPDLITIMGGSNDVVFDTQNIGQYTDTTDATVFGCMYILIQRIKTLYPNVPFAILTPFPHNYEDATKIPYLETFVDGVLDFCLLRNVPCLDLFHNSGIRPDEPVFNAHYFSSDASPNGDGLHLNFYGQRLISSRIREFMMEYFGEF